MKRAVQPSLSVEGQQALEQYAHVLRQMEDLSVVTIRNYLSDLRHRFGYRMAEVVPLHRLAQIMGHDSLDTTMLYIRGTKQDLQHDVEKIAWT